MQITYQKRDGSIIQKYRKTMLPYKIGEETSMGWKVLNIEYEYKNKYYSEHDYNTLVHKKIQKSLKNIQNKDKCKEKLKKLMYYFITALALNILRTILGI